MPWVPASAVRRPAEHFARRVWLNPDDQPSRDGSHTGCSIQRILPVLLLSVDGIVQVMLPRLTASVARRSADLEGFAGDDDTARG